MSFAAVLKGLPPENADDLPPSFDLPMCTLIWKLVSGDVAQAHLSIAYADFFKGLVCVDYFAQVLAGDLKILDNLKVIQGQIAQKTSKPMMSLDLLMIEIGLRARELAAGHFRSPEVRERWEARNVLAREVMAEPYYNAIASYVRGQVRARTAGRLDTARSRLEIKALLFIDAADGPSRDDVFEGSIAAVEALRDRSTPQFLRTHLESALERKRDAHA